MSYEFDFPKFPQQGWQCPICHRVYSPITPMCYYCGNEKYTTTTGTATIDRMSGMPINEWGKSTTTSGESYIINSSSKCNFKNNVCDKRCNDEEK